MARDVPRTLRRFQISQEPAVTYAIGDVHGELDKLIDLERRIVDDGSSTQGTRLIVMLGDYVDRGPRSAEVLNHLIGRPPAGFHRISLLGNHDAMLLDILEGRRAPSSLIPLGGLATFASYGCDLSEYENGLALNDRRVAAELRRRVPTVHGEFLRGLPALFETPRHLFVHAGIRPGVAIADQEDVDLLWIREPFLSARDPAEKLVVHGHTPGAGPQVGIGRVGVDTGATYGGALTAVKLGGTSPSFLHSRV